MAPIERPVHAATAQLLTRASARLVSRSALPPLQIWSVYRLISVHSTWLTVQLQCGGFLLPQPLSPTHLSVRRFSAPRETAGPSLRAVNTPRLLLLLLSNDATSSFRSSVEKGLRSRTSPLAQAPPGPLLPQKQAQATALAPRARHGKRAEAQRPRRQRFLVGGGVCYVWGVYKNFGYLLSHGLLAEALTELVVGQPGAWS